MITNDVLTWLGLIISIIFGLLSIIFYVRTRLIRRLSCLIGTVTLQRVVHPEVIFEYRGVRINDLSRMLVFLWNSGSAEIRKGDIPNNSWPTLLFPAGTKILSVATLSSSTTNTQIDGINCENRAVNFTFKYLNPGDGCIVEVLYENNNDFMISPVFEAPIIGGYPPHYGEFTLRLRKELFLSILESLGGAVIGLGFAILFTNKNKGSEFHYVISLTLIIFGIVMSLWLMYIDFKRLHHRLPRFMRQYLMTLSA